MSKQLIRNLDSLSTTLNIPMAAILAAVRSKVGTEAGKARGAENSGAATFDHASKAEAYREKAENRAQAAEAEAEAAFAQTAQENARAMANDPTFDIVKATERAVKAREAALTAANALRVDEETARAVTQPVTADQWESAHKRLTALAKAMGMRVKKPSSK